MPWIYLTLLALLAPEPTVQVTSHNRSLPAMRQELDRLAPRVEICLRPGTEAVVHFTITPRGLTTHVGVAEIDAPGAACVDHVLRRDAHWPQASERTTVVHRFRSFRPAER